MPKMDIAHARDALVHRGEKYVNRHQQLIFSAGQPDPKIRRHSAAKEGNAARALDQSADLVPD